MKSLQQIANKLKLPPSTVRYYAKNYKEYLPSRKIEGVRWPMYEESAENIIRLIAKETGNKKVEQIKELLSAKHSPIYDGVEDNDDDETGKSLLSDKGRQPSDNSALATTLQQMSWFTRESSELNTRMMGSINHQRDLLKVKDQTVETLKGELENYKKMYRDKRRQYKLEKEEHEETKNKLDKLKNKGFFKRMAKAINE